MTPSQSAEALVAEATTHAGAGAVRVAGEADLIDGMRPHIVAAPASSAALAATLGWAATLGLRVMVRGGGTKLTWGGVAQPADLLLSTRGLRAVVAHRHGDLTATVEAGATLSELNEVLARHRQWLPLDPPWADRATIGGIVATNDSGPRRHAHGAPRDLIIGVTMARSDGQLASAGGIVVKNVAGYDLSRLLTGAFGSLGVVVSATFKLTPLAPASRTITLTVDKLTDIGPALDRVMISTLTPSVVDLRWPSPQLRLRFESVETAVDQLVDATTRLLSDYGDLRVHRGDEESMVWADDDWWDRPGTLIRLSTLRTALVSTLDWLTKQCTARSVSMAVLGRAGLGVVTVRLEGALPDQVAVLTDLRARLPSGSGAAVVRRASTALRDEIDPWGPLGDALPLMRAVKAQFDPETRLNRGRAPGGL